MLFFIDNTFQIAEEVESLDLEKFLPLRGEITRVFLYNFEFNNEDILESFFTCDNYATFLHSSKIAFDWTNVLFDGYMDKFKRKSSGFCLG